MRLLVDAVSRDGECVEEMSMLVEGVAVSSDSTLQHYCSQWTDIFIKNMQVSYLPLPHVIPRHPEYGMFDNLDCYRPSLGTNPV